MDNVLTRFQTTVRGFFIREGTALAGVFLENFKTNSSSGAVLWVLTIFFIQDRDGSSLLCMVLHRLVDKIQIQLQVKKTKRSFLKNVSFTIAGGITAR